MQPYLSKFKWLIPVLAIALVLGFAVSATPVAAQGQGGNEDCPPNYNEVAKFEWNGGYTPDGPNTGNVQINGDATGGTWTADVFIGAIVIKGGPNAGTLDVDPAAKSGTFTNTVIPDNGGGNTPDISNIKFCQPQFGDTNIIKEVVEGDTSVVFDFFSGFTTLSGREDGPFDFTLRDGRNSSGFYTNLTSLTWGEYLEDGWEYAEIVCESLPGSNTQFSYETTDGPDAASIVEITNVDLGDDITCTFKNTQEEEPVAIRVIKYNDLDEDGTNNEVNQNPGAGNITGNTLTGWEFFIYDSDGNYVADGTTAQLVEGSG